MPTEVSKIVIKQQNLKKDAQQSKTQGELTGRRCLCLVPFTFACFHFLLGRVFFLFGL
jgi:hypothetical protein